MEQPEILYGLFKGYLKGGNELQVSDIKRLLTERPVSGWSSIDQFFQDPIFANKIIPDGIKAQVKVNSDYFELRSAAKFEQRVLRSRLLFQIVNKKAQLVRYQSGVQ